MSQRLARNPLMVAYVLLVLGFVLAPLGIAVAIGFSSSPFLVFPPPGWSLRWIERFLGDAEFVAALFTSLKLAAVVTVLGLAGAAALVFGIGRVPGARLRGVIAGFVLAPLLFPVVLLGVGLLLLLARIDLLGAPAGLAAAHLVIVLPLCYITLAAAIARLNPEIAEAAASLGAGPGRVFWLVTLPQIRASLAGAAILSFLFSFNDVVFAAFLGGPDTQTLPLKLFGYIRYRLDPLVGAVSVICVALTLGLIVLADRIVGFDHMLGLKGRD